ncbi:MAG TPA: hypothetical protein VK430_04015 [Xanthobacteraceae bacterium]|nr:hypothetical protein [Xanthobacteraceae bacterium]
MVSFIEQLHQGRAKFAQQRADPLRERVQAIVRGMESIGTAPLLDLLGLPKTTGKARLVSKVMRALGFVPIKSRRLEPGGYRDTVTRGWTRPFREIQRNRPDEDAKVTACRPVRLAV